MDRALNSFYSLVVSYPKTHSLAKPGSFVLWNFTTREQKPYARTSHE